MKNTATATAAATEGGKQASEHSKAIKIKSKKRINKKTKRSKEKIIGYINNNEKIIKKRSENGAKRYPRSRTFQLTRKKILSVVGLLLSHSKERSLAALPIATVLRLRNQFVRMKSIM